MLKYTNIPALLCEYALVNRKINQLKLYIYLKINCSGEIAFTNDSLKFWSNELKISLKTTNNSLKWLIKHKWVTVNSKKRTLRIISYKRLSQKLNLDFRTGFFYEPEDFKLFKAMCCGVVVTYYLNKKRYYNRRSVNNMGFAKSLNRKRNGFYPMPNMYLAKSMNISMTTAYRIKKEAENCGFIDTKENWVFILDNNGNKLKTENHLVFMIACKEFGMKKKFRKGKKYLKEVGADLIHSNIILKKKRIFF